MACGKVVVSERMCQMQAPKTSVTERKEERMCKQLRIREEGSVGLSQVTGSRSQGVTSHGRQFVCGGRSLAIEDFSSQSGTSNLMSQRQSDCIAWRMVGILRSRSPGECWAQLETGPWCSLDVPREGENGWI